MSKAPAGAPAVLGHWGLSRPPFQDALAPDFFYPGGSYREAVQRLRYAVTGSDSPFAVLLGEPGMGKSLVQEVLAAEMEDLHLPVIQVRCLSGAAGDPWGQIAAAAGRELASGLGRSIGRQARDLLAEVSSEWGHSPRILGDDAHRLSRADLEEFQWLAEGPDGSGCQVVLAGSGELERLVAGEPAVRTRCLIHFRLQPLSVEETGEYLVHRLRTAGHGSGRVFEDVVVQVLHHFSRGLPRILNRFSHLALEIGSLLGAPRIGVEEIRRVLLDYYSQRIPLDPFTSGFDGFRT